MNWKLLLPAFACLALLGAGCGMAGPRPVLREPRDTLGAMETAWAKDDVGLFLHTLSAPVLKRYSEHTIRLGWSELRPHLGPLVEQSRVVEVKAYSMPGRDLAAGDNYVWPHEQARLMRVRLEVRGAEEDFLFMQEVDPAPEGSRQAPGVWIGDRYYTRREHRALQTYAAGDVPEKDRTHWRLVFPYYPFQKDGRIAALLQEEIARTRGR